MSTSSRRLLGTGPRPAAAEQPRSDDRRGTVAERVTAEQAPLAEREPDAEQPQAGRRPLGTGPGF